MPNDAGEFQRSLFTLLSAAPEMNGIQIVDEMPQAEDASALAGLPAIEIGDMDIRDWSTSGTEGDDIAFRLHVWNVPGSLFDLRAIQGACKGLLHRRQADLTLPRGKVVLLHRLASRVVVDKAHGVCDYRALVCYGETG